VVGDLTTSELCPRNWLAQTLYAKITAVFRAILLLIGRAYDRLTAHYRLTLAEIGLEWGASGQAKISKEDLR